MADRQKDVEMLRALTQECLTLSRRLCHKYYQNDGVTKAEYENAKAKRDALRRKLYNW